MPRKKRAIILAAVVSTGLLATGCTTNTGTLKIGHVQGLAYSPDGQTLYLATDAQVIQYNEATGWLKKATDSQIPVQQLAFKAVDFDLKATALHTGTIYVWLNESHKPLAQGLSYSKDAGKTWTHVAATGLQGEKPLCIAVNPDDDRWVAIGTAKGLALSDSNGERFDQGYPQLEDTRVTAVSFDTHNPDIPLVGANYKGSPQALSAPFPAKLFQTGIKAPPEFWHQDFHSLLKLTPDDEITHLINNPSGDGYVASTKKGNLYYFDPAHQKQKTLIESGVVHFEMSRPFTSYNDKNG